MFKQKETKNPHKISNKLTLSTLKPMLKTEKWDRLCGQIQVGPSGYEVKPKVKTWTLVGGGLKDARWGAVGPTGWSENHHKGGGGEVYLLRQSTAQPCRSLCGFVGPTNKITKISRPWKLVDELRD